MVVLAVLLKLALASTCGEMNTLLNAVEMNGHLSEILYLDALMNEKRWQSA